MKDLIDYYFSLSIFVTTRKYVSNGIKTNERRGMPVEKCWPDWPENVHWPDGPLSIHFKWPVHNFTGHWPALKGIPGICSFSAKHTALRRKTKDWLTRNQSEWSSMSSLGSVKSGAACLPVDRSEWSSMSSRGLLFQWTTTTKNPTKCVGLVQSGYHYHLI